MDRPSRARLIKLVLGALGALGIIVLVLITGLLFVDLGVFRAQLEAGASNAFGRRVTFEGELHLEPSLRPTITIEDMRIANPDWASRPDFARIQRLEVKVALLPLVQGELEVLDVSFRGADMLLEVGEDDADNFTFGRRVGPPRLPDLHRFNLTDSVLGYRTQRGQIHQCSVSAATARNTPKQPVELDLRALCNEVPLQLSLSGGTPEHFAFPRTPWPVTLRLSTGDTVLAAEGGLPNPGAWEGARFQIVIEGEGGDSLEGLFDAELPVVGPFQFSAKLSSEAELFKLSDLAGFAYASEPTRLLTISEGEASAGGRNPVRVSIDGRLEDASFGILFTGDSLAALASGTEDWPLRIEGRMADALFSVDGAVKQAADRRALVLQAELKGRQLATLDPLLGAALPIVGPYRFTAVLESSGDEHAISSLTGKIGSTDIAGELRWKQAGARPSIWARLGSRSLHLEELVAAPDPDPAVGTKPALLDRPLPPDWLDAVDVDFALDVGRISGGPVPIRDAALRVTLKDQELSVSPFKMTLSDARMTGDLSVALRDGAPAVRFAAQAQGLDLTRVLRRLEPDAQVQAGAEKLKLAVTSRGNTLRKLLGHADFRLDLEGGQVTYRGAGAKRTWDLAIASGEIGARGGGPLKFNLEGSYGAMPLTLRVDGVSLAALASGAESWPLKIEARSADTVFAANGAVSRKEAGSEFALRARLEGRRVSTLNPLLQTSLPDTGPFGLSAELRMAGQTFSVSGLAGDIGSTDIAGELAWDWSGSRTFLQGRLASRSLDMEELFGPSRRSPGSIRIPDRLDQAIAVDWLASMDAEMALDVQRARGGPVPIRGAKATARLNNGTLVVSPLRATLAGASVRGDLSLALERGGLDVQVAARSDRIDLGRLFGELGASAGIDGELENLVLEFGSRGRTPRSLLRRANLSLETQRGRIVYEDERLAQPWELGISAAEIAAAQGQSVTLSLEGEYRAMPVSLELDTVTLETLAAADEPWSLGVSLQALAATLNATGIVSEPFQGRGFKLAFEIRGRDLKALDPLIDFVIPLRGDYAIEGRFADHGNRYELTDMRIHVGQSDLAGSLVLLLEEERPRITASLSSRLIHYDDLEFVESEDEYGDRTGVIPDYKIPVQALLSVNLEFDLAADEIRMRGGKFGDLLVKATLNDGRGVWSAQVRNDAIGGRLSARHEVDVTRDPPRNSVRVTARDLDYGLLLTQAQLTDLAEGRIDVDIELAGPGATQRGFLAQSDGHISVLGGPGRISNRGLQLWTADLFVTMLSGSWMRQPMEEINCVVGHIDVAGGVAKTDKLLLDTRRFTLAGSGALDMDTEEIDLLLDPQPKRRRLVSLANPVRITGTLADPQVAITVLPRRRTAATSGLLAGLVNPAFLLLAYSDTSTRGGANPCEAALEQRDARLIPEDFTVETTRDLVRLCRVQADDPLFGVARGFCLAYVDGAWDYHEALTAGANHNALSCPGYEVTRNEAVRAFLSWADANTEALDTDSPVHGVMQAFSERWPCGTTPRD